MKHTKIFGISAVAAFAWLAPATAVQAAFGDTDTTFGTSTAVPGFTITDLGGNFDFGQDIVTGLDDRIYTLGMKQVAADSPSVTLIVSRFTKDGVLDTTFGGGDGQIEFGALPGPGDAYHFDVFDAADPADGRIYLSAAACAQTGCTANIARFTFDGNPDGDYGTNGLAKFPISPNDPTVNQIMVLSTGKVLVLFQHQTLDGATVTGTRTVVARLDASGQLDPAFGTGGRADVSAGACDLIGAAFMTIGRPAFTAYITTATRTACDATPTPAVSRILSDGSLDPGFGTGGHVVGDFGTGDIVGLVAQDQVGGGIAYAMANFAAGNVLHVDIIGLNDDGTRDASVPTESATYDPIDGFANTGGSVFQTDGRMVLNGRYQTSPDNSDQAITRIQGSARLAHAPRFAPDVALEQPFVGFATASASVDESAGTATITVTLTKRTTQDVTVPFTLGGSATRTVDYNIAADHFFIPAGELTSSVTVTIINDDVEEADEAILFTLGTPENAKSNPPSGPLLNAFILNIADDDLQVTPAPQTGDGSGSLDLLLLSGLLGLAGLRRKSLRRR